MFAFAWSSCGRKPECLEETHLSDLVTTLYIEGDNQMLLTYYQYFDSLAVVVDG